jgi:hypothetical protein
MFSSERCHPISEGWFLCSDTTTQAGGLAGEIQGRHIDKYDGSSNPKEFIQVYHTIIEAAGGDDRVKVNYLPTALSGVARSWLINLPDGSIYTWDQLCGMFIKNF